MIGGRVLEKLEEAAMSLVRMGGVVGKCKHPRAQVVTYRTLPGSERQAHESFPFVV